ncbi:MAG TPA: gamma-glutamyltransferase [Gemmataceae bacterium]|jgi:gamma-glutamyltranspeptidase/glutathione hydrolase|nr:gamma-glutamyltransferase [Gemmataceae bacterium]
MSRFGLCYVVVLMPLVLLDECCGAERPPVLAGQSGRSVVMAPEGMVCCAHPLAAQIGIDVLKSGGNAVDAAIAVNAALGLMEPMSCGAGGDLFAIVWDAKTQKLYGLNASGRAPYRATRSYFAEKKLQDIPETGALSWSVPGCMDGWEELRRKFGTRSFAQLLEPSIRYAEAGAPVPEVIAGYWRASQKKLAADAGSNRVYLIDGRAPAKGDVFKNPALAQTYRLLAKDGRDAFYRGPIAEQLVAYSERVGGLLTLRDFAEHTSTWVEPVHVPYRGYEVYELPPNGQGIAALQMLNLLEGYDLKKMGPNSADYWHLFIEAKKLAFADRAKYYTDLDFAKAPVAELISKKYSDERRKLIHMESALAKIDAGDPKLGHGDTTYLCVVDKDRNCVSLIQSNYMGFGSGKTPPELGFALQNRGCLFALDEKHANRLEPHKRPFHTIIPAMVLKDGKPWLVFGVMGGDMQPQGHVEVLVNLIDFGMDVQAAGEAPRMEHRGSATPTGHAASSSGTVLAERGIPESVIAELEKRGHHVNLVRVNGGGYQAILIDPKTNMLHGGSEARKDGCALGY